MLLLVIINNMATADAKMFENPSDLSNIMVDPAWWYGKNVMMDTDSTFIRTKLIELGAKLVQTFEGNDKVHMLVIECHDTPILDSACVKTTKRAKLIHHCAEVKIGTKYGNNQRLPLQSRTDKAKHLHIPLFTRHFMEAALHKAINNIPVNHYPDLPDTSHARIILQDSAGLYAPACKEYPPSFLSGLPTYPVFDPTRLPPQSPFVFLHHQHTQPSTPVHPNTSIQNTSKFCEICDEMIHVTEDEHILTSKKHQKIYSNPEYWRPLKEHLAKSPREQRRAGGFHVDSDEEDARETQQAKWTIYGKRKISAPHYPACKECPDNVGCECGFIDTQIKVHDHKRKMLAHHNTNTTIIPTSPISASSISSTHAVTSPSIGKLNPRCIYCFAQVRNTKRFRLVRLAPFLHKQASQHYGANHKRAADPPVEWDDNIMSMICPTCYFREHRMYKELFQL
jgi:hypothetical protein